MSKPSDEKETPEWLFKILDKRFFFNLDPCATDENAKCSTYFTKEDDGLSQSWDGPVFMNPPYSRLYAWCEKAYEESLRGELVVGLLPGDHSTRWYQDWVEGKAFVWRIPTRISFANDGASAKFASVIAIWCGFPGREKLQALKKGEKR